MASNSIKGLTVKIGADTSDFIKGLKSVDREINQTQKTANALQKGLKLDYNEKNFIQAQKHTVCIYLYQNICANTCLFCC